MLVFGFGGLFLLFVCFVGFFSQARGSFIWEAGGSSASTPLEGQICHLCVFDSYAE